MCLIRQRNECLSNLSILPRCEWLKPVQILKLNQMLAARLISPRVLVP
jgi:hypothetical protein